MAVVQQCVLAAVFYARKYAQHRPSFVDQSDSPQTPGGRRHALQLGAARCRDWRLLRVRPIRVTARGLIRSAFPRHALPLAKIPELLNSDQDLSAACADLARVVIRDGDGRVYRGRRRALGSGRMFFKQRYMFVFGNV